MNSTAYAKDKDDHSCVLGFSPLWQHINLQLQEFAPFSKAWNMLLAGAESCQLEAVVAGGAQSLGFKKDATDDACKQGSTLHAKYIPVISYPSCCYSDPIKVTVVKWKVWIG